MLVRAPGAETPTPIPGCQYWRQEACSYSIGDAIDQIAPKNPIQRSLSPKIEGRRYRMRGATQTRLPKEYPHPGMGVGVSAPGARTSEISNLKSLQMCLT